MHIRFLMTAGCLAFVLAAGGCNKNKTDSGVPSPAPSGGGSESALYQKGRTAYMTRCMACHNIDPAKDGNVGPAIAGSSTELLNLRVLEAKYPEGHKPKRTTRLMTPMPFLKPEMAAIEAYVNGKKN